jgi:hypothetical protein
MTPSILTASTDCSDERTLPESSEALSLPQGILRHLWLDKNCAVLRKFRQAREQIRAFTDFGKAKPMKVTAREEGNATDEKLGGESKSWALRIPCGEVTLSGDLEIPPNAVGIVLFAHGSGSSRFSRRNRAVAGVLRASGVGTLLFDLLTEDEEAAETYTRHLRFDIGLLTRRLATVTEEMADDPRVRGLGLGYFGSSTGGAAALRAASRC